MRLGARGKAAAYTVLLIAISLAVTFLHTNNGTLNWLSETVGAATGVAGWVWLRRTLARSGPIVAEGRPPQWPTGDWSVELVDTGARRSDVVAQIQALTGATLEEAHALALRTPSVILADVNGRTAHDARTALRSVGAKAEMTWPDDSAADDTLDHEHQGEGTLVDVSDELDLAGTPSPEDDSAPQSQRTTGPIPPVDQADVIAG